MTQKQLLLCGLVALLLVTFAPVSAQGTYQVAILVVDDFTVGAAAAPGGTAQESCAATLEGQVYATRGASTEPAAPDLPPHGAIVYEQLETLVEENAAAGFITLVEVDIDGMNTTQVAGAIETAIAENPADYYVINMSFALIPCDQIAAFEALQADLLSARQARDLNRYRGALQRAVTFYDGTVYPANSQRFQQQTGLDPLQDLLVSLGTQAVPVAAAGNFGLNYPFWPAAWAQVISVSGSAGSGFESASAWTNRQDVPLLGAPVRGNNRRISNYGEVMLPGEFTTEAGVNVIGTSFAAPRLSFLTALYLSDAGDTYCRDANGNPSLASGDWDNLTLSAAITAACPDMSAYIP